MLVRATLNSIVRSQKYVKLLRNCQKNVHTTIFLQCQDAQNNSITTSPSVFSFDSALTKTPQKSTDVLETKLFGAKSSNEVLQLVSAHSSIMNNRHISNAFSLLHSFLKQKPRKELQDVSRDRDFVKLCKRTLQIVHHITPNEAITIFKTLGFLNVPSSANIMQAICQVIRCNINSLPLDQIVFLMFLLRKHQPTPLTEALLIALPLVLQSQLDLQMNPENMNEMVHCLEVAATRNLNDATIQKLAEAILLKAEELTVYQACTIIASVGAKRQFPSAFEELALKSFDVLTHGINSISEKEERMILTKMAKADFTSIPFLTALVDKAIHKEWDLIKLCQLLAICEKFEFISEDLLHYAVSLLQLYQSELATDNRISVTDIIGAFALAGYESTATKIWTAVINCQKKLQTLQRKSPLLFLKFNSNLSILGCHPLPSVFEDDILSPVLEHIKEGKLNFAREICTIEWATKIVNTNVNGPHLPNHVFQEALNRIGEEKQKKNFFLEPFLKVCLGGVQFFNTNLMTKYGHEIDHVVVLRKGDYPIAIENTQGDSSSRQDVRNIKFVEDLLIPPESKILTIIAADQSCYCKNSSHLKGWMKFQLFTLRKLGYLPLLFNLESWNGLLSHEKIPYLMREMKEILKQSEEQDVVNVYPAM